MNYLALIDLYAVAIILLYITTINAPGIWLKVVYKFLPCTAVIVLLLSALYEYGMINLPIS